MSEWVTLAVSVAAFIVAARAWWIAGDTTRTSPPDAPDPRTPWEPDTPWDRPRVSLRPTTTLGLDYDPGDLRREADQLDYIYDVPYNPQGRTHL